MTDEKMRFVTIYQNLENQIVYGPSNEMINLLMKMNHDEKHKFFSELLNEFGNFIEHVIKSIEIKQTTNVIPFRKQVVP